MKPFKSIADEDTMGRMLHYKRLAQWQPLEPSRTSWAQKCCMAMKNRTGKLSSAQPLSKNYDSGAK